MLSDDDEGSGDGYSSEPKENSEPSKESNSQHKTGKFYESLQELPFSQNTFIQIDVDIYSYKSYLDGYDLQYDESLEYECTKKVMNRRTKRPLLFLRMERAKELCKEMSTCMGIMKQDCSRRLTRLYLCESAHLVKSTKQKHCVLEKANGMLNLRIFVLCDAFISSICNMKHYINLFIFEQVLLKKRNAMIFVLMTTNLFVVRTEKRIPTSAS